MRIEEVRLSNFKGFKKATIELNGKSTVFFGVNGTGKSTVLSAINYVFWTWINRLNNMQGVAYRSLTPDLVHFREPTMLLEVKASLEEESMILQRFFVKADKYTAQVSSTSKKHYDQWVEMFRSKYLAQDIDMPIFVNYGTNRSVLDIPLRIRKKHEFSQLTALEHCIENELDFRTFFEWFRNQEDLENEYKSETQDWNYSDPALKCVRVAIQEMLQNVSAPRVKRSPLRMVVRKDGVELRVDQLSDGEKCTLALLGDLARRMALANPYRENPLEGSGVVLIDEIELHMHPSWQRRVLRVLREVFPNIQFIITTHSPQVLSEVTDDYLVYRLENCEETGSVAQLLPRMDGYDSNYILEEFMDTRSMNPEYKKLLDKAYSAIADKDFDKAHQLYEEAASISDPNAPSLTSLDAAIRRGQYLHAKNHKN